MLPPPPPETPSFGEKFFLAKFLIFPDSISIFMVLRKKNTKDELVASVLAKIKCTQLELVASNRIPIERYGDSAKMEIKKPEMMRL